MSQVRYHPLGPLLSGEGSRAFLGLALESGATPRPVVLVWAPPEVARDAELTAQLQRETQRASVLVHPNILRVHEMVSLDAGLARVTEFADGESLRRVLEVRPRMPPAFAAQIVSDAAMGIHYAHMAGNDDGSPLVHGDLRPETVMVSFAGVCKVAGYGALSVAPRERNGRRVRNRRKYSAPEQLMGGREAITPRTDVFLLGLLLYECLSGRMPFQEAPDADQAVLTRALPALPSDVPRALAEVIRLATAKRANERYPNALEFREALVASVEGNIPSASVFSEFLTQLFPPDRDARATRRQLLEIGLADLQRRPSLSGVPAVPAPAPAPAPAAAPLDVPRPSGSTHQALPSEPVVQELSAEYKDIPFDEDDANTFDSVLEITGRHARPGVARPLERDEPSLPPTFVEPALPPPAPSSEEEELDVVEEAPVPRKRRSRTALIVGSLGATTAVAAGGFLLWNHLRTPEPPPPAPAEVATVPTPAPTTPTPPPVLSVPAPPPPTNTVVGSGATDPDAGTPPSATPPTAVAAASEQDSGVPPTQGTSSPPPTEGIALASGSAPASTPGTGPATPEVITTRLKLFVLPPVDVVLEGKPLGHTPLTVPLAPGQYTLELSNPLKDVRTTRAITVQPQGLTTQRVMLGKGTVQVKAPAGSHILLNGHKAGPKLSLYEGEHQLVVTHGKDRWEKTFKLQARQRMTVDVASEKP